MLAYSKHYTLDSIRVPLHLPLQENGNRCDGSYGLGTNRSISGRPLPTKRQDYGPKFILVSSLMLGAGSGHYDRPAIFGQGWKRETNHEDMWGQKSECGITVGIESGASVSNMCTTVPFAITIVRQHNAPQYVPLFTVIYHLTATVFLSGSEPVGCVFFFLPWAFRGFTAWP